jgi:transcription initiation factor IIE alpha subunit
MSDDFAVRCRDCRFTWNTATMAEGLRVLGSCPKCKGELEFSDREAGGGAAGTSEASITVEAPHMVLGLPRI